MNRLMLSVLALALVATPALADDPGGGGTKPVIPVTGEQVYRNVCQACHMADGKGATGAATIPALANNKKLAVSAYPIMMVAGGQGAMPWFNDLLNPAQIAGVVTYIRTHFGNKYTKPVTAEEVAQMMPPPPTAAH